jgi:hypothetical protein
MVGTGCEVGLEAASDLDRGSPTFRIQPNMESPRQPAQSRRQCNNQSAWKRLPEFSAAWAWNPFSDSVIPAIKDSVIPAIKVEYGEEGFHAQTLEIFDPMGLSDMPAKAPPFVSQSFQKSLKRSEASWV